MLSMQHILIVFLVIAIVFGASKLPQLGEGMGKAIKNFKKALNDDQEIEDITPKKTIEDNNNK